MMSLLEGSHHLINMITPSPRAQDWRELYRAALSETDARKQADRIAAAQRALIQRARESFLNPGDNLIEEHQIDNALRALHALRVYSEP